MSKRMPFASAQNPCGEAQNDAYSAHSAHSHSVQQRVAGYNGPVTRSRVLRGHSSSSIIHSLPLEILGEILILALPTDRELCNKYDSERLKLFNPTLVLCAVCSSWRFLAFSTPQLAKRKAANLLSITTLLAGNPCIFKIFNHHYLCFALIDGTRCGEYIVPIRIPNHAQMKPLLGHISRTSEFSNQYLVGMQLMIFMKCPKLVYLSILVDPPTFGQSSVTVPIVLEDLVTFHFRMNSVDSFQTLIHQLYLPSLREFSIDGISTRSIQPVLNLLTQSSCSLDTLEIRDYLNVLTHLSCDSLTSLTILDEDVLRRLTLHRNDAVCRHLTFLGIEYCIPASLRFSRVILHTGQTNTAELDEIGRRSGMEYSREGAGLKPGCFSVWFRRQGFGEPPNIGELF
ncbi:hypothetical protein F5887DRAFT_1026105 [Amanita rubescens]|nr:hypothetical protein F5887DRAFT_1026105 [Amanita rubescens]